MRTRVNFYGARLCAVFATSGFCAGFEPREFGRVFERADFTRKFTPGLCAIAEPSVSRNVSSSFDVIRDFGPGGSYCAEMPILGVVLRAGINVHLDTHTDAFRQHIISVLFYFITIQPHVTFG
jgi:hypothetical protein